jgi:hypothetical protein
MYFLLKLFIPLHPEAIEMYRFIGRNARFLAADVDLSANGAHSLQVR